MKLERPFSASAPSSHAPYSERVVVAESEHVGQFLHRDFFLGPKHFNGCLGQIITPYSDVSDLSRQYQFRHLVHDDGLEISIFLSTIYAELVGDLVDQGLHRPEKVLNQEPFSIYLHLSLPPSLVERCLSAQSRTLQYSKERGRCQGDGVDKIGACKIRK